MGIGLGLGIGNQDISGRSPAILDIPGNRPEQITGTAPASEK